MTRSISIKKLFLGFILSFLNFGFSQNLPLNVTNRQSTLLNGTWNYIIDPYETGYYSFHRDVYDQKLDFQKSAYYANYHSADKNELVEYDFDKSPTMHIPNDWNSQDEKLLYYEGTVWFKKSFDYILKTDKKIFLYFGAVNYKAEVYLNGKKLGTHLGGFTSFDFDVTQILKEKNNFLVVKVDNTRHKEDVPALNTDWWNYGGITRDVLLVEEPNTFVQDYEIQLKKGTKNIISGFIKLNEAKPNENITLSIPELKISKLLKTNEKGVVDFEINTNKISYWCQENPKLYDVAIKTDFQTLKDQIGFRTIETKEAKIWLNGKPIFLKGISIHEENATGGRANSEADDLRLLTWAKELGCNYVRLAHYPHNENMVKLADKMGLMVWDEIPVYWTIDFSNQEVYKNAENQLTTMVNRDKNRAAVIIWSMANETPQGEDRNKFITNLANKTRLLDNTRLVSAALLTRGENGVGIVDDKLGESLDIVAFNQYLGWYGGNLDDADKLKWTSPYNKPIVVSEFGGGAKQGLHGTKTERWTEEYQEYLYQQNLLMIAKIPNISGLSPWILVDFRSPKRLLPNIQDGYNRKGLISNDGLKKNAFFVLKDFYDKIDIKK